MTAHELKVIQCMLKSDETRTHDPRLIINYYFLVLGVCTNVLNGGYVWCRMRLCIAEEGPGTKRARGLVNRESLSGAHRGYIVLEGVWLAIHPKKAPNPIQSMSTRVTTSGHSEERRHFH